MNTIGDRIRELYSAAIRAGVDPVRYVQDYLAEKDSHATRDEAQRLIWLYCNQNREAE